MSNLLKTTLGLAMATATVAVAIAPVSVMAWSDGQPGGRPSYTVDQINKGVLGNKIVFNTISDSPMGNEKNFVGAREVNGKKTADGKHFVWNGNEINIEENKDYVVRMYVHNNNPNGLKAVAKDVRVMFNFGEKMTNSTRVGGYITSSNATPSWYYDDVVLKSDRPFKLAYVAGSALLENNKIGKGGLKLSDDIVKKDGVKIGYDALDGNVPGCFQYANYITIKVRPIFNETEKAEFTVEKFTRKSGEKTWQDSMIAKVGDRVQYGIKFKNVSKSQLQKNVMIKDILPKNVEYIPGTTMLYNSNHKNGTKVSDNVITSGINIGDAKAGGAAWVVFDVKVIDNSLFCGITRVRNWGQAGVGQKTIQDYADLLVEKKCEDKPVPPTPPVTPDPIPEIPETGPATTVLGILGIGAVATALSYFVTSRKKLQ